MALDNSEIKKIADLAKLKLTNAEIALYQDQLAGVLSYVDKINEIDLDNVRESLSGADDSSVGPRPDELRPSFPEVINSAPNKKNSFVVSPNVFDK